jgi:hypothetical protein
VIVAELRTNDGTTLKRIPADAVRKGLSDHWLEYSDEVRTASGDFVSLDETSSNNPWPSAVRAAHQQFLGYQLRFAYVCTAIMLAAPILKAVTIRPSSPAVIP